MAQLNARLVAVRAEVADKKAKVDLLDKLDAQGGDNEAMPDIANSGPIVTLRNQLAEISTREAGLTSCNSANYPELIKLRAERAEVQSALAAQEQEIAKTIRNEYSLALARRDLVEKIWREVAGRTSLDDKEAIELSELERTASVRKDLFDNFLETLWPPSRGYYAGSADRASHRPRAAARRPEFSKQTLDPASCVGFGIGAWRRSVLGKRKA